MLSSALVEPWRTRPSAGKCDPGRTFKTSPFCNSAASTRVSRSGPALDAAAANARNGACLFSPTLAAVNPRSATSSGGNTRGPEVPVPVPVPVPAPPPPSRATSISVAVVGCSAASARIASDVFPLALASNHFPRSTNDINTALVSKNCDELLVSAGANIPPNTT
eukprot:31287-Pelagococcus_subviridis.AAC.4